MAVKHIGKRENDIDSKIKIKYSVQYRACAQHTTSLFAYYATGIAMNELYKWLSLGIIDLLDVGRTGLYKSTGLHMVFYSSVCVIK